MATQIASRKSPGYARNPTYRIAIEPSPRRVRAAFGGAIVADTTRALLMREERHLPVYYVPLDDVRRDLLRPTAHATHCLYKGDASYWSIAAGDRIAENAVWAYAEPFDEVGPVAGHCAFYWDRMDHWYEEDEEIFCHPRDPHKRVDAIGSLRAVRVVLGGETVAVSRRAMFLFETNLPTRYYLPIEDVRMDLLRPTATRSICPYKGTASYWSAEIGGKVFADIAWGYPDPIPECPKIKGLLAFWNEKVDAIFVDEREIPKIKTPWSKD